MPRAHGDLRTLDFRGRLLAAGQDWMGTACIARWAKAKTSTDEKGVMDELNSASFLSGGFKNQTDRPRRTVWSGGGSPEPTAAWRHLGTRLPAELRDQLWSRSVRRRTWSSASGT